MVYKTNDASNIIGNDEYDLYVFDNKMPEAMPSKGSILFINPSSNEFFNVLKGDMSLVGTRPPTLDEWNKYELRHRARLAFKPGITGMWQVSGRSNITDFEEIARLDKEYIKNWRFSHDIQILLKTVQVVFKKEGSM